MKEIDLGLEKDITASLPAEVDVDGETYFLAKKDGQYTLLSNECPHAGGIVKKHGDMLYCPFHMWRFDSESGECMNVKGYCLDKFEVTARDGRLIAVM